MLTPPKSSETWQLLIELRCQREVIERWLASCSLPNDLQQNLSAMLRDVDRRLQALTKEPQSESSRGL
jgi:hypothetical protein